MLRGRTGILRITLCPVGTPKQARHRQLLINTAVLQIQLRPVERKGQTSAQSVGLDLVLLSGIALCYGFFSSLV